MEDACICYPGYAGEDCSLPSCPNECSGHGTCNNGLCDCVDTWSSADCSRKMCHEDCNGRGKCDWNGTCWCYDGYGGEGCGTKICANDCSNHGTCVMGLCKCDAGWQGHDCNIKSCTGCSKHGTCLNGTCYCTEKGWEGTTCDSRSCPSNCMNNGQCNDGVCSCITGTLPPDCRPTSCAHACAKHGTCEEAADGVGKCHCADGWLGEDCDTLPCSAACLANGGLCNNGTCICPNGGEGADCGELSCPRGCSGDNGVCNTTSGVCTCNKLETGFYWQKPDCASKPCLYDCNSQGYCHPTGECQCYPGWKGMGCQLKACPQERADGVACSDKGTCLDGKCTCVAGFQGEDCSELSCMRDGATVEALQMPGETHGNGNILECRGVGLCKSSKCFCPPGRRGEDCELIECPDNCGEHLARPRGTCSFQTGNCTCNDGFDGPGCKHAFCPNNCSLRGVCRADGTCACFSKYAGDDCAEFACPNNCTPPMGVCVDSLCRCLPGSTGADCSNEVCPGNCNGHGTCVSSQVTDVSPEGWPSNRTVIKCDCQPGWAGPGCTLPACGLKCPLPKVEPCQEFGFGAAPRAQAEAEMEAQMAQVRHVECCHDHGTCFQNKCTCDPGWEGTACHVPVCLNSNTTGLVCGGGGVAGVGECVVDPLPLPLGKAECACYEGKDGVTCQRPSCPNGCSGNGVCFESKCLCFDGFHGAACGQKTGNKTSECCDRCQLMCHPACEEKLKNATTQKVDPEEVKTCALGCMTTCNEKCMSSSYSPEVKAAYCESRQCRGARESSGKAKDFVDMDTVLMSDDTRRAQTKRAGWKSLETDLPIPRSVLNQGHAMGRPDAMIKTMDFSAQLVSDSAGGSLTKEQEVALQGEPSKAFTMSSSSGRVGLDLDQISIPGLSASDMEMIITGNKPN